MLFSLRALAYCKLSPIYVIGVEKPIHQGLLEYAKRVVCKFVFAAAFVLFMFYSMADYML